MATATSAVNAALTAIVSAVTASVNDTSVLITEGPPTLNQPDDLIVIGERINQQYAPHALVGSAGSGFLHETFQVSIVIDVFRGGDNFTTTRSRCMALSKLCDDAIRNDPTLAGSVYLAYPSDHSYEQLWEVDSKGTRVKCDMFIHCQAIP